MNSILLGKYVLKTYEMSTTSEFPFREFENIRWSLSPWEIYSLVAKTQLSKHTRQYIIQGLLVYYPQVSWEHLAIEWIPLYSCFSIFHIWPTSSIRRVQQRKTRKTGRQLRFLTINLWVFPVFPLLWILEKNTTLIYPGETKIFVPVTYILIIENFIHFHVFSTSEDSKEKHNNTDLALKVEIIFL